MQEGQSALLLGSCSSLRPTIKLIVAQMTIPLIQGTLRYAEISSRTGTRALDASYTSKALAEGTAFAAAVVPRLVACPAVDGKTGEEDAEAIWAQMKHPASTSHTADFGVVKQAFERHYACLNITCEEVGGHYDHLTKKYEPGAEPCITPPPSSADSLSPEILLGIIIGGGVLALLCLCMTCFVCKLVKAERKGKPVFVPMGVARSQPTGNAAA